MSKSDHLFKKKPSSGGASDHVVATSLAEGATELKFVTTHEDTDYLVGLRRIGTGTKYSVVVATLKGDEVLRYEVDPVSDDLEYAVKTMMMSLRRMVGEIP